MAGWGWTLIVLGIGSFFLQSAGMEFIFLAWVDQWGNSVGNAIRIGVAVLGAILIVVSRLNGSANRS